MVHHYRFDFCVLMVNEVRCWVFKLDVFVIA